MKRIIMTTGIAILAIASVVGAQGYAFNTNLTVGSTGSDVSALQTWLIANGFTIPSVESGAASKGYFGAQTKSAVMKFQASRGVPSTGFVGPLTRGQLNGGSMTSNPGSGTTAVSCPAGFICTPATGTGSADTSAGQQGTVVSGPSGITTPGVPGIMTVSKGPLSTTVSNVGQQMVPVLAIRVQAQYSDVAVQSMTLDLGTNTTIYSKIFNKVYVTDGTNVLASVPLNSSTVVQSGTEYVVGLAGFNFVVAKGQYRDLVIKADINPSIDTKYLAGGTSYPNSGTGLTGISAGWGVGLVANGLRAVDGAGVNLYNTSAIAQGVTINTSLVDTAQANVSLSASTPTTQNIPVTDTTNGQYLGLNVLSFDINAQNDNLRLDTLVVNVTTSGTGSASAAYLYNGTTPIMSASVSAGVATFSIARGTTGATIPRDSTAHFTVKVDVTGVTSGSLTVTASTNSFTVYNTIDAQATINGSATGYTQTVASVGPLFTLVGTPTLTVDDISAQQSSNVTKKYTARFNVSVQAVGTDVMLGLPASTTANGASFGTSTTGANLAVVYANSVASTTLAVNTTYSQPTGTSLSADGTSFLIARNQTVTIPVTYVWSVINPANSAFALQVQGINWTGGTAGKTLVNFMANRPEWRTSSI